MSSPQTYDELLKRLSADYSGLSKKLQEITEFALKNPDVMALETIAKLSELAGVHPSALIRFAQAFGYAGFRDMQQVFRSNLVKSSGNYADRIQALGNLPEDQDQSILSKLVKESGLSLQKLEQAISLEDLEQSAEMLYQADAIHVLAQGRAYAVATYLQYALGQLGKPTYLLDGAGGMLAGQAGSIRKGDILIAISFKDYSKDVLEVMTSVQDREVEVLAITDSPVSPLKPLAEHSLLVEEAEFQSFRSLSNSLTLALALVLTLGKKLSAD